MVLVCYKHNKIPLNFRRTIKHAFCRLPSVNEFIFHLQCHKREFGYIITCEEKLFVAYFNYVALF